MKLPLSEKIRKLARNLNKPLYVVGGYVRNFLIDKSLSSDIDICAPITTKELLPFLYDTGFTVLCEYKRTGTVVFCDGEGKYEFTSFRKEVYENGGFHTPSKTTFTEDIFLDALRRDFKCNAIYYDIKNDKFVDPLNGIEDIKSKTISTVKNAKEVFCHDGLRLLRLARFCAELNFKPDKETIDGATLYSKNIKDISSERILDELKKILISDKKYPFSDKYGHYTALKILDDTRVLDCIIPELTMGRGMKQRADFHDYDVLEHTLRAVKYADSSIRLSALFHDIGKPFALKTYNKYHDHALYGKSIAKTVLERLKIDKKTIAEVCFLTENHMFGVKGEINDGDIMFFIAKNKKYLDKLLMLFQADYSACKDDLNIAPLVKKFSKIMEKMKEDKIPFSIKELDVNGLDLQKIGVKYVDISKMLDVLLKKVCNYELKNEKKLLIKKAQCLNV